MNKRKGAPQKIKDVSEVKEMIVQWFERENKPVTPQSLTDALGSRVAKPLVQKTLDELFSGGRLQAKDLKKVRFFYLSFAVAAAAAEDSGCRKGVAADEPTEGSEEENSEEEEAAAAAPTAAGNDIEAGEEDEEGNTVSQENHDAQLKDNVIESIVALSSTLQEKEQALTALMGFPTAAEREARLETLSGEVTELQREVAAAEARAAAAQETSEGSVPVGRALDDAVYRYQKARALWKERKEFTDRLVEGVLGDACSKAELTEVFGITTDAEAGVSFVGSAVYLPASLRSSSRH